MQRKAGVNRTFVYYASELNNFYQLFWRTHLKMLISSVIHDWARRVVPHNVLAQIVDYRGSLCSSARLWVYMERDFLDKCLEAHRREKKTDKVQARTISHRITEPIGRTALYQLSQIPPTKLQSNLSLRPPDKSDHLKIPDTPFQSLQFSDSNVQSVFLKMQPPEKCELRTPYVGPKLRINLGKATKYIKLSEKNFFDRPTFPSQALRTSNHRVCKLDLAWSLPIMPPRACGNYRSLMAMARAGHVYGSILKIFEPSLANETTWEIGPLIPSPFGGRNSDVDCIQFIGEVLAKAFPSTRETTEDVDRDMRKLP